MDFGAWYLARQLSAFGDASHGPSWDRSVELAAAAYNGGPGSVTAWLRGRALPAEAELYRREVLAFWRVRHDPWPVEVLQAWADRRPGVRVDALCAGVK